MDISNNTLAWLVVTAVVVSIGGTAISLNLLNDGGITGYATSNTTGNVSVAVASVTTLQFVSPTLSIGSGSVVVNESNCSMYMGLSTKYTGGFNAYNITRVDFNDCEGFENTTADGTLILENAGNTVLNVTLNFSSNAAGFVGGGVTGAATPPGFWFNVFQNETGSCSAINASLTNITWTNATITTDGTNMRICTGLSWTNANDTIGLGIYVSVPVDASGAKAVNIIAQGTG